MYIYCIHHYMWVCVYIYIWILEYCSFMNKNGNMSFVGKWMELEFMMWREISHTQNDKYHVFFHIKKLYLKGKRTCRGSVGGGGNLPDVQGEKECKSRVKRNYFNISMFFRGKGIIIEPDKNWDAKENSSSSLIRQKWVLRTLLSMLTILNLYQ
jgi:hypothetical protein